MGACPLVRIDRAMINRRAVTACRIRGDGWSIRALAQKLRRRAIEVRLIEHDLLAEMQGTGQTLDS